jgi:hypothetical protein
MLGSQILDVFIGLSFIYFFLSLVCMWVQEVLAALFKMRQKNLVMLIANLLNPDAVQATIKKVFAYLEAKGKTGSVPDDKTGMNIVKSFFDHSIISSLSKKGKVPSYIPGREFALVLTGILKKAGLNAAPDAGASGNADTPDQTLQLMKDGVKAIPDASAKDAILTLISDAKMNCTNPANQPAVVQKNFEAWFNSVMERASGWYKRKAQVILFVTGFILAFCLNADSIEMFMKLWTQPETRSKLTELAKAEVAAGMVKTDASGKEIKLTKEEIEKELKKNEDAGILLGWQTFPPSVDFALLLKILGILITGFGISMGSPFWWDLLNRFVNLRMGGKKPEAHNPLKDAPC